MSYIGNYTDLRIDRFTSVGAYLSDDKDFEVLLPNKYLTHEMELDQMVNVFIYNDSEDRPVATTEHPKITFDEYAFLTVKSVNQYGAFLDWGLEKDLLVPFKEQTAKMVEGGTYLIRLLLDEQTDRLIGSAKINKFLEEDTSELNIGDEVELFIAEATDLGRKVIVENQYQGLIYHDRLVKEVQAGDYINGYIEFIRHDGKLDISLVPVGEEKFDLFSEKVLNYLSKNDGVIAITDKSDPLLIREELGMSKKSFKKAVGNLYRERKIVIKEDTIELVK